MGAESRLYDRIKKGLPEFDWQRFEDSCSTGIPDLNGCAAGVEVWIEAKVADARGRVKIRPGQIAWLARRWAHGGLAWLLVERDNQLRLYRGCDATFVATGQHEVFRGAGGPVTLSDDCEVYRWPARRTPWASVKAWISRR